MLATLLNIINGLAAIAKVIPAIIGGVTKYLSARRTAKLESHIQEGQEIERRLEEATNNEERAKIAEELAHHISGKS